MNFVNSNCFADENMENVVEDSQINCLENSKTKMIEAAEEENILNSELKIENNVKKQWLGKSNIIYKIALKNI